MVKLKLYDLVKDLLVRNPELRNSDKLLSWKIWTILGYVHAGEITEIAYTKAPSEESIGRARRKVQEKHPELQATEGVKLERKKRADKKGVFIYHEEVKPLHTPDFKPVGVGMMQQDQENLIQAQERSQNSKVIIPLELKPISQTNFIARLFRRNGV